MIPREFWYQIKGDTKTPKWNPISNQKLEFQMSSRAQQPLDDVWNSNFWLENGFHLGVLVSHADLIPKLHAGIIKKSRSQGRDLILSRSRGIVLWFHSQMEGECKSARFFSGTALFLF